jgi:hypothetical protein
MRSKLLLFPAAVIAAQVPGAAWAEHYLTLGQAQALLFPGATFEPAFLTLGDSEREAIVEDAQVTVWNRDVKVWKVSTGGWFFLDQVLGRDDWISYAVALDEKGVVKGVEILECLENWNGITLPAWRKQFIGARYKKFDLFKIQVISGATLSSNHVAEGVKRLLTTHAFYLNSAG